jgi:undecaprenyl-diphosphatase
MDAVAILAGLALLVACGIAVRDGTAGPIELRVFRAVNGLPDGLSPPMQAAQLLGVLAVGPLVALVALALRRWRLAAAAALATLGKLAAERVVWELVERSRPGSSIEDAVVRGNTPSSGASFVSGHVVLTSALAWVATPYLSRRWRVAPWALVTLVAFARVYLGAHAPLDVVGGAALGIALGGGIALALGVPDPRGVTAAAG